MNTLNLRHALPVFLAVLAVAVSCAGDPSEASTPAQERVTLANVSYGPHERQRMDVHLPAGRDENTPIAVLVHGGAWVSGSKTDFGEIPQLLLSEGIGVINIEYRYATASHHFEGLMADVGLALAAVREKAGDWGIRKARYQLFGGSAGGHIALLYAYHYQQHGEVSSVVSFAGPTALSEALVATLPNNETRQALGTMVGDPPAPPLSGRYALASPITYVDTAVPTLLAHGTADPVVPYSQATQLESALRAQGKTVELFTMEGVGHDFAGRPEEALQLIAKAVAWLNALK